jgi:phage terminase large subunit-like protein
MADRYIEFIKLLKLHEGSLAGKNFPMLPFQEFIIAMIAGWRRKSDKIRRYVEVYIQMAKKNAKTTLAAAIILSIFFLEPDASGQYIFSAPTRNQARLCFKMSKKFVETLRADYESVKSITQVLANAVYRSDTNQSIFTVSKEAKNVEGQGGNVIIIDEYHAHLTDELKDNLQSGQAARVDPLSVIITTAGASIGGPCHQEYDYGAKVLDGIIENDRKLYIIFEIDPKDDWADPNNLIKANPCMGSSLNLDYLMSRLSVAVQKGGRKEVEFRTKHLNQWVSSESVWISDRVYLQAMQTFENNRKDYAYGGLDLAYSSDSTSLCLFFPDLGGYKNWYWIPEKKLEDKSDRIDWKKAVNDGLAKVRGTEITDYDEVVEDIKRICKDHNVRCIYVDPYNANQISLDLEKEGIKIKYLAPKPANLSPAVKELERLFNSNSIVDNNNWVTRFMMSNANVIEKNTQRYLTRTGVKKIDGIAALINAYSCYMVEGNIKKHKVWAA